jgi:hypothetical protein
MFSLHGRERDKATAAASTRPGQSRRQPDAGGSALPVCWALPFNLRLSRGFRLLRAMHKANTGKTATFRLMRR